MRLRQAARFASSGSVRSLSPRAPLPKGAILINMARGPLVVETDLAAALTSGHLGGAGIDVTEIDPLAPDSPLWDIPNLIITPHISTSTWETRTKMTEITLVNLMNGLTGKPLMHCVNPDVYGK